jgi:hypothetical protein
MTRAPYSAVPNNSRFIEAMKTNSPAGARTNEAINNITPVFKRNAPSSNGHETVGRSDARRHRALEPN